MLLDMVSPAFFDVMPARSIAVQAARIARSFKDPVAYGEALQQRADALARTNIDVAIGDAKNSTSNLAAKEQGRRVLSLYFHQFLETGPALLDLRAAAFGERHGRLLWDPAPLYMPWDPTFRQSMGNLYRGFYEEDDDLFRQSLSALGLLAAERVFRAQFGTGDQRAVVFETKSFVSTFHEAFVLCQQSGDTLHPNFMGMGISLALLYDHLEALPCESFDVRQAYFDARSVSPAAESLDSLAMHA